MHDAGYRMQGANPIGAFPARSSALIRYRVPGLRCQVPDSVSGLGFSALGLDEGWGESRISLAPHPSMAEGRIPSTENRAGRPGTRYLTRSDAEGRTPSTEDRARPLGNAHTGSASCHPLQISTGPWVAMRETSIRPWVIPMATACARFFASNLARRATITFLILFSFV